MKLYYVVDGTGDGLDELMQLNEFAWYGAGCCMLQSDRMAR